MPRSPISARPRAATLADVGRAAGVSAMAASTVLNGAQSSTRTAPATRQRILDAAARLQYRPNATARALVNRRMNTIGVAAVVADENMSSYVLEVFTGILIAAARHEQSTTMFTLQDWTHDAARLAGWCDGRIDGMILIGPTLSGAAARALPSHTPFVALHANIPMPDVVNVESDEERGAFEMVRHLISLGHRRIMHISGDRGMLGAERRIKGYRRALVGGRIPFSNTLFVPASYRSGHSKAILRQWLRHHAGEAMPDAVFCGNDGIAADCLEVFAEIGLRVPEDISVAGFDDTLAARTTIPQLATVRQPLKAMGSRAVEVLLDLIGRQHGGAKYGGRNPVIFPVELALRASVGDPPALRRIVPVVR